MNSKLLMILCMIHVSVSSISNCLDHFKLVGNQCLLFNHDKEMTWIEANWFCKSNQAELILLKDLETQDRISKFLNHQLGIESNFWIGGYYDSESRKHWNDGSSDSDEQMIKRYE